MRILAVVDIHGSRAAMKEVLKKAEKADVIVSAGDISIFGGDLDNLHADLNSSGKPVIVVHGNHETSAETEQSCSMFKNLHFIHRNHIQIDDVFFLGYGGGGFSRRDSGFEALAKGFAEEATRHKKVVLVLHGPPYGTTLDRLGKDHHGNKSFTDFINTSKLDLVICGHLHETAGKEDTLNDAKLINPGPKGKILEI